MPLSAAHHGPTLPKHGLPAPAAAQAACAAILHNIQLDAHALIQPVTAVCRLVLSASAGLCDARTQPALTYLFKRRTGLTTALSISALQGDARNSPLLRQATTASGLLVLPQAF